MAQFCFPKQFFIPTVYMLLLTGSTTCKKATDPVSANSIQEFESRLDDLRKVANIPGMVGGIMKNGQVIWVKNYGYADKQKNIAVSNSTYI